MPVFAYAIVLTIPLFAALLLPSVSAWALTALFWLGVPLLDACIPASRRNAPAPEEQARQRSRAFDALLYVAVPVQIAWVLWFVQGAHLLTPAEFVGGVLFSGTTCGVLAINVAHELGHRSRRFEQRLAKILLVTTLYTHFYVEHNRGHHARVATPDDPASARRGETVYAFWVRSLLGGLRHGFQLEADRIARAGGRVWSFENEVVRWKFAEATAVLGIWAAFGAVAVLAFLGSSLVAVLLLETVNYVEHYGLARARKDTGAFERVRPAHSWTSDHPIGRALLFDLPRHADHHANPTRPFQVLRHCPEAPELPTGYAGMVLIALCPPVFFGLMHRRLAPC